MSATNNQLRLAVACAIQVMIAEAQETDGFTSEQIDYIDTYGPCIDVAITEFSDDYSEPVYRVFPNISDLIAEIKKEIDEEESEEHKLTSGTLFVFAAVLFVVFFGILFGVIVGIAVYGR